MKAEQINLTGWITEETLKKVIVWRKPKKKSVKVEISIVPIKESR